MSNDELENMNLDDDLASAFLEDDNTEAVNDSLLNEEAGEEELPEGYEAGDAEMAETEEEWVDEPDDFPGQLAVDVYETEDHLIVKARTAGIERKDLDVSISDNILTISGVLSGGEDEDTTQWHIQECYWGEFSRTIALPVAVKEEGVEAVLKDGVLTISFEKEVSDAPKRINIQ